MESSSSAPYHTRSNSLPSRSNAFLSNFDEQLIRIRSSESASCSTSSSISSKLTHLTDLYDSIDELLQFSSSQKALSSRGQEKSINDLLEGSIKLLDICTIVNDVLVQMKERAQDLQSILRRRCSEDEISMEVARYMRSRKMAVKTILKALKDLKKMESTEIVDVISRLKECQMETFNVLELVLSGIAGTKAGKWESVVSKLLKSKRVSNQRETELFLVGFEAEDAVKHPERVRSGLEKMEISIKVVEQGLECLFRHLIKTRTTILNIIN